MEILKVKDWKNNQRRLVGVAEDLQSNKIPEIQFFYLPKGVKDISSLFNSEDYKNFRTKQREDYYKNNPPKKIIFGELGLDMSPCIGKCAPSLSIIEYLKTVQ